jgi:hypothetical protein
MPRGSVISIIRASDVDAELTGSGGDRSSAVFIVGEKLGWRAMLGCPKESIMLRQEGVVGPTLACVPQDAGGCDHGFL